jgi:hypothetical protein
MLCFAQHQHESVDSWFQLHLNNLPDRHEVRLILMQLCIVDNYMFRHLASYSIDHNAVIQWDFQYKTSMDQASWWFEGLGVWVSTI